MSAEVASNLSPAERRRIRVIRGLLAQYELVEGGANLAQLIEQRAKELADLADAAHAARLAEHSARVEATLKAMKEGWPA